MIKRGANRRTEARNERLARYAQMRDQGMYRADICRELDIETSTGARYERWYLAQRNLPPGKPNPGMSST